MNLSAFNSQSSIRVDSQDLARPEPRRLELVRRGEMIVNVDVSVNLMVKLRAPTVLTLEAQVGLWLAILSCRDNVSENGHVQEHVTSKHHSPRGDAIKRGGSSTAHSTHGSGERRIDDLVHFGRQQWASRSRRQCAESVP